MQGVAPVNGGGRLADKSALDLPVRMHAVDALSSEPLKASALTLAAPGFSLSFITLASRMTSRMKESLMAHLMHIHWICIAYTILYIAYALHVHVHVHVHVGGLESLMAHARMCSSMPGKLAATESRSSLEME